jgi:hypothetical protein
VKIQVLLKSDKNKRYYTWRPVYIYNHTLLNSSWNEKYFRQKLYKNHNTHFIFNFFFWMWYHLWQNMEEYGIAGQDKDDHIRVLRRKRFECCVNQATYAHSEYVILIALPRQRWLHESASTSPLYLHCLSCILTCYRGGITQIEELLRKERAKKTIIYFCWSNNFSITGWQSW